MGWITFVAPFPPFIPLRFGFANFPSLFSFFCKKNFDPEKSTIYIYFMISKIISK